MMEEQGPYAEFARELPLEHEVGAYANAMYVWHSGYDFTLDFAVQMETRLPEDGSQPAVVPNRIVSRVRVPPSLLLSIIAILNDNVARYEEAYGEIKRI